MDEFVAKMNDKAEELGLENTHFENPAGIDARGNYSSAADLATITREAMKHPEFRKIVDDPEATISTQDREIDVFTTNLLVYPIQAGLRAGDGRQDGHLSPGRALCRCLRTSGDESYIAVVLDAAEDLQRFEAARRRSSTASASTNTSLSSNAENLTRNWNCPTAGARR